MNTAGAKTPSMDLKKEELINNIVPTAKSQAKQDRILKYRTFFSQYILLLIFLFTRKKTIPPVIIKTIEIGNIIKPK